MVSRRALLATIAYTLPAALGQSAASFLGRRAAYSVRYVYRSTPDKASSLLEMQRAMESAEVIEKVNAHFLSRGELLSFNYRSSSGDLIYDYAFTSEKVHFDWQEMMEKHQALNLSRWPVRVSVQNFSKKRFWFTPAIDRQVTIEIS